MRSPRKSTAPASNAEIAFESVGLMLGRVCIADPRLHLMLLRGLTQARAEVEAGRKPSSDAGAAINTAAAAFAEAVGVPYEAAPPRSAKRPRRRARARG